MGMSLFMVVIVTSCASFLMVNHEAVITLFVSLAVVGLDTISYFAGSYFGCHDFQSNRVSVANCFI